MDMSKNRLEGKILRRFSMRGRELIMIQLRETICKESNDRRHGQTILHLIHQDFKFTSVYI